MRVCIEHASEKCVRMAHFYPITILPSTVYLCTCVCRVASLHCSHAMTTSQYYCYRAGEIGPDTPVLAGPVFLKVKIKFHFYKRQVINKSACVIFGLVRLIILSQKSTSRRQDYWPPMHAFYLLLCSQGFVLCKKLSNKQNSNAI